MKCWKKDMYCFSFREKNSKDLVVHHAAACVGSLFLRVSLTRLTTYLIGSKYPWVFLGPAVFWPLFLFFLFYFLNIMHIGCKLVLPNNILDQVHNERPVMCMHHTFDC